jgi:hypothetical protein
MSSSCVGLSWRWRLRFAPGLKMTQRHFETGRLAKKAATVNPK